MMRHLSHVWADLLALARPAPMVYLALGLALQALYWTLGSPGPQLAGAPRDLGTAAAGVAWAVLLLLVVPLTVLLLRRELPPDLRLRWGNWRFGLTVTAVVGALAAVGMGIGARFPEVQATYPWPGAWAGTTVLHLLTWTALYAAYYLAFEFFYRGFLLRTLESAWGLPAAIWAQTAASTLVHLGKPLPETLAAIPFGLLFAVLAVRGRSLLWPVLLHLVIGLSTDVWSLHHQGWLLP
jgi:uncharacterized protein